MSDHPIGDLMKTTLEEIRQMTDSSTIIGEPIKTGDTTIIPVSKIVYGFASGGSDFPSKSSKGLFGGGAGAGVTVSPVAFLVIDDLHGIKLIQINPEANTADRLVGLVPDLIDKLNDVISNSGKKGKKAHKAEENINSDEPTSSQNQ